MLESELSYSGAVAPFDRRSHARYTVQIPLELLCEGESESLHLVTTDLSHNGCYVKISTPLAVGTRIQITLWMDQHRIVAHGRIVTRHPEFGNGIMFLKFEADGEPILHAYLNAISDC